MELMELNMTRIIVVVDQSVTKNTPKKNIGEDDSYNSFLFQSGGPVGDKLPVHLICESLV